MSGVRDGSLCTGDDMRRLLRLLLDRLTVLSLLLCVSTVILWVQSCRRPIRVHVRYLGQLCGIEISDGVISLDNAPQQIAEVEAIREGRPTPQERRQQRLEKQQRLFDAFRYWLQMFADPASNRSELERADAELAKIRAELKRLDQPEIAVPLAPRSKEWSFRAVWVLPLLIFCGWHYLPLPFGG